jgi:hypothetical protein
MTKQVSEHIPRHHIGRASAALPGWAAAEFTESKAAVMRVVGVEMANNRGVCALHIKAIAAAAGVSVETARGALRTAKMIGLVTVEHLQGFYDIRSRAPTWLAPLRELQERIERFERETAGQCPGGVLGDSCGEALRGPRRGRA